MDEEGGGRDGTDLEDDVGGCGQPGHRVEVDLVVAIEHYIDADQHCPNGLVGRSERADPRHAQLRILAIPKIPVGVDPSSKKPTNRKEGLNDDIRDG